MLRSVETTPHPDDLTLLRYVVDELNDIERGHVDLHLRSCPPCVIAVAELRDLDGILRDHKETVLGRPDEDSLPADDPFRERPEIVDRLPSVFGFGGPGFLANCQGATREAGPIRDRLLAAGDASFAAELESLALDRLVHRYALGYALQEAVRRIALGPLRFLRFAELAVARLQQAPTRSFRDIPADQMTLTEFAFPLPALIAEARLLAGVARNWTGEYDRGAEDFRRAYQGFGEGKGSEESFATVELHEAQRRCFAGQAALGLPLASRSLATFEAYGLDEDRARALYARAVGLSYLDRDEEAILAFGAARDALGAASLWGAYVSAINGIGTCLIKLGRLDEARREYARALRRTVSGERPAAHAFIRYNLALTLFEHGYYRQAVGAFRGASALFNRQGMRADALVARLYLIEALASCGSLGAAHSELDQVIDQVRDDQTLDPSTIRELQAALAGDQPNLLRLTELREASEGEIRRRLTS
ncbi:MAG: tetratricopeptide repeat protein [Thermoanaerobaculia bacterium]